MTPHPMRKIGKISVCLALHCLALTCLPRRDDQSPDDMRATLLQKIKCWDEIGITSDQNQMVYFTLHSMIINLHSQIYVRLFFFDFPN